MAKCLRRVRRWAHQQLLSVAVAHHGVCVPITRYAHLIVVVASGMYSIGNRFKTTYIFNPFHNDSDLLGCNCAGGCRKPESFDEQSTESVESYKSYLCVELSFFLYEDAHYFSREAGEARWVTAVPFGIETLIILQQVF